MMILIIGYLVVFGIMLSAQVVLYDLYEIGFDPEYDSFFRVFVAAIWPLSLIPLAFYWGTQWWLKTRGDDK